MVIISNVTYPPEVVNEVAKRFLDAPPIPDFLTKKGPYISSDLSAGIQGVSFYELDRSRLADGMGFLGKYFSTFFGIPGYKYEFKPFFPVEDALKMIGMG